MSKESENRGLVVEVLRGHVDAETAWVDKDHPDGVRIRCRRRLWIERCAKGQQKGKYRMVYQTTDVRNGRPNFWRKLHPSGYVDHMWLCRFENGHVDPVGYGTTYWSTEGFIAFYITGIWAHLTDIERSWFERMHAYINRRMPDKFKGVNALIEAVRLDPENAPSFAAVQEFRSDYGYMTEARYQNVLAYVRMGGTALGTWTPPATVVELD